MILLQMWLGGSVLIGAVWALAGLLLREPTEGSGWTDTPGALALDEGAQSEAA